MRLEEPIDIAFDSFHKRYFIDVIAGDGGLFEFKAVESVSGRHRAQLLHYLLLCDVAHGKLINVRPEDVQHEFVNSRWTFADREKRSVTGRYLSGAMSVLFGGVPASFTVNNDDQITATGPTGSLTGPISISTPVGTSWSSTNFKVTPHIIGFSPTSGPAGTIVTITGSAFTGATRVKFNGISAGFLIKSYTKIRTTVPAQATTGSIAVTTPGGTAISGSSFTVT